LRTEKKFIKNFKLAVTAYSAVDDISDFLYMIFRTSEIQRYPNVRDPCFGHAKWPSRKMGVRKGKVMFVLYELDKSSSFSTAKLANI
jgi:hypothetical protein